MRATFFRIASGLVLFTATAARSGILPADDGYRGIWFFNQPSKDEYRYKYSGGMATYPQQHAPIAVYCRETNRTFFVYGGTTARAAGDRQTLLHMVSYFDHATGTVPRPRILLNKKTRDAHDNPILSVDDRGYLWVFSPSHGTGRPSYIHRGTKPWSIEEFQGTYTGNFSYAQAWNIPARGFLFLHTRYGGTGLGVKAPRCTGWMTSPDGLAWSAPTALAAIEMGDYQISWPCGRRVASVFDFHPTPVGLNARANLYYAETDDLGAHWKTAGGVALAPPFTNRTNPALVYDSVGEGKLVYLKDLNFDADGRPVILFLTSRGYESGPKNGPREWKTIRWTGAAWETRDLTTSDNNYDHGSLYIEPDGAWRVIAPTDPGPQPYNPGGEMVLWTSGDQGATWKRAKALTRDSRFNHTYARRPLNAHPGFYALWADGHGREPSQSALYFTDREGTRVWRLPARMDGESARPEAIGP